MINSFNRLASNLGFVPSLSDKFDKKIGELSLFDKKEFEPVLRQILSEKSKYIPKKGKFEQIEGVALDMAAGNAKEQSKLSESAFLLFFDQLSLKEKMRVHHLVGDYIDDEAYPREAFDDNLMSIIKDDFMLRNLHDVNIKNDPYHLFWVKLNDGLVKAQSEVSPEIVKQLEKEIMETDGLQLTGISEAFLSAALSDEEDPEDPQAEPEHVN